MSKLTVRTQILLTKEQMAYLAKVKKQTGESIGTLIRRCIDEQRKKGNALTVK
jgi:hypothetical protein